MNLGQAAPSSLTVHVLFALHFGNLDGPERSCCKLQLLSLVVGLTCTDSIVIIIHHHHPSSSVFIISHSLSWCGNAGKKPMKERPIGHINLDLIEVVRNRRIRDTWALQDTQKGEVELVLEWTPVELNAPPDLDDPFR